MMIPDDDVCVNVEDDKSGPSAKAHLAPSTASRMDNCMDVPLGDGYTRRQRAWETDTKRAYGWGKVEIVGYLRSSQTMLRYRSMEAAAAVEVVRLVCMPNFVWGVPIPTRLKSDQCT